jgi:hypothetical protein
VSSIDDGYWIEPTDHLPEDSQPVEVEYNQRTPDGKHVTGVVMSEILLLFRGQFYTTGRQRVCEAKSIKRWRRIL